MYTHIHLYVGSPDSVYKLEVQIKPFYMMLVDSSKASQNLWLPQTYCPSTNHCSHWKASFHKTLFSGAQLQDQMPSEYQETLSLWGWPSPSTDCPGKLWSVHPWRYSKASRTQSWATDSRWLCLSRGVGPHHIQNSLPTSTSLQFCEETGLERVKRHTLPLGFHSRGRLNRIPSKIWYSSRLQLLSFSPSFVLFYPITNNLSLPCPQTLSSASPLHNIILYLTLCLHNKFNPFSTYSDFLSLDTGKC